MKIAELFLQLGVKGQNETKNVLSGIKQEISSLGEAATDMVAGITGMIAGISASIYAFKQFSKQSNQAGQDLVKFENITGMSADRLQRWQYLGLKAAVSADQMKSAFLGVQSNISKLVLSQGTGGPLGALISTTGFDVKRARDLEYTMTKVREYAQKLKTLPEINEIAAALGVSPEVLQAFKRSKGVDLEKVSLAHRYSEKETKTLSNMGTQWDMLGDQVEHAIGRLNAKFGPKLVKDLTQFADVMIKFVDLLATLAEKLQVMKGITGIFESTNKTLAVMADSLTKRGTLLPSKEGVEDEIRSILEKVWGPPPTADVIPGGNPQITNNVKIEVNGAHDPQVVGREVERHVRRIHNDTFRSISANGGSK